MHYNESTVRFIDLGIMTFGEALDRQDETVRKIASGILPETVCFLEHPHVFTIGRRGLAENLIQLQDLGGESVEVFRINRGGDVTYHGPGQLVVYPHLDLRLRKRDLGQYLRNLEQCVIGVAGYFGIRSYRRRNLTGVWTDQGKLASIGIGVRQWITMHGLALNVSTDLSYFDLINPCGIPNCPMTSLERLLGKSIGMDEVKGEMRRAVGQVFGLK